MRKNKILAYALVIVSTLIATFAFYFWQVVKSPNINVDGEETAVLYIPKGATYETVLDSLNKHELIHDQISFGFLSKFMEYRDAVKPGRYEIEPNASNKSIISKLRSGDQDEVKLTFNNIRLKSELAEKLAANLAIDKEVLLSKLNEPEVCEKYGFSTEEIMSMFLPDTYFMWWTLSEDEFLDRMKFEYDKFWTAERLNKAETTGMTPVQVSTMASIVQSETNKGDEQPRVAGVYVNRIKNGIPLQADPTVKFAVGDFALKRILNKHLSIDSPYNTYKVKGLPPGPIALPEKRAIDAVLNFEDHNYLYFCAKEDFSGYHNFAATLAEHNANARRFHTALNQRGIR
ncbi:endolytic transglycosylase MltG [Jiulongibacter sediminis]|uniref:Endolytic murein transglycosylase n=1 Tax=Jiulongibacter sediminis TaxID=1605367 RepID=A0A0P7C6X4_9BACT|nr:endolytic transglycosylase MltG [Jiulongibacter sediminis]KPM49186.1 aminodeoxychorismate lyase [Jiulongibacter sediminis]TBX26240.1 aminodeoxychorismate lyase [Jiulongibacter sediminis]